MYILSSRPFRLFPQTHRHRPTGTHTQNKRLNSFHSVSASTEPTHKRISQHTVTAKFCGKMKASATVSHVISNDRTRRIQCVMSFLSQWKMKRKRCDLKWLLNQILTSHGLDSLSLTIPSLPSAYGLELCVGMTFRENVLCHNWLE